MNEFKINKISKSDFLKLDEKDLMFITNPGRMGDEDGSTFIIRNDNEFIVYRVDGFMYPNNSEEVITLDDMLKQFPKWHEVWHNQNNKDYQGKYKYIYMGFGNGLSVDNSIYDEYKYYLDKEINNEEDTSLQYANIFNAWDKAFINMVKEKEYVIK